LPSELVGTVMLMLVAVSVVVGAFLVVEGMQRNLRIGVAEREGSRFAYTLYDMVSERVGAAGSVKVPFRMSLGSVGFASEPVWLSLSIAAGGQTFTLGEDVLYGSIPFVYYAYNYPSPPTASIATSYVKRGSLGAVAPDPSRNANLFEYWSGVGYVAGVAWLPAFTASTGASGDPSRLAVTVVIPEAEGAVLASGSSGSAYVSASHKVETYSYVLGRPSQVTVSLQVRIQSLPRSLAAQETFAGVTEVDVVVVRERIYVGLFSSG